MRAVDAALFRDFFQMMKAWKRVIGRFVKNGGFASFFDLTCDNTPINFLYPISDLGRIFEVDVN
jgi:hypothetical protein